MEVLFLSWELRCQISRLNIPYWFRSWWYLGSNIDCSLLDGDSLALRVNTNNHGGHHRTNHAGQQGEEKKEDLRDTEVYVRPPSLRPPLWSSRPQQVSCQVRSNTECDSAMTTWTVMVGGMHTNYDAAILCKCKGTTHLENLFKLMDSSIRPSPLEVF